MGKVRCKMCGVVLESKHRHDFQQCGCLNMTFVDGGSAYVRCGGADLAMVEVLNEARTGTPEERDNGTTGSDTPE